MALAILCICYKYIITYFTTFVNTLFYFPGAVSFPLLYSIANYFDFVNPLFQVLQNLFLLFYTYIIAFIFYFVKVLFRTLAKIIFCYTYIITILISFVKGLFSRFILLIGLLYSLYLYTSKFYGGCQGPILNTFLIVVYYSIL